MSIYNGRPWWDDWYEDEAAGEVAEQLALRRYEPVHVGPANPMFDPEAVFDDDSDDDSDDDMLRWIADTEEQEKQSTKRVKVVKSVPAKAVKKVPVVPVVVKPRHKRSRRNNRSARYRQHGHR